MTTCSDVTMTLSTSPGPDANRANYTKVAIKRRSISKPCYVESMPAKLTRLPPSILRMTQVLGKEAKFCPHNKIKHKLRNFDSWSQHYFSCETRSRLKMVEPVFAVKHVNYNNCMRHFPSLSTDLSGCSVHLVHSLSLSSLALSLLLSLSYTANPLHHTHV